MTKGSAKLAAVGRAVVTERVAFHRHSSDARVVHVREHDIRVDNHGT